MHVLTIDPGINTGWTLWYRASWGKGGPAYSYLESGTFSGSGRSLLRKQEHCSRQFLALLNHEYPVKEVFIEVPGFNKHKSNEVYFIAGMYAGIAATHGARPKTVTVEEWKGQLGKESTLKRLKSFFTEPGDVDLTKLSSHEVDAVGIGCFLQGHSITGRKAHVARLV